MLTSSTIAYIPHGHCYLWQSRLIGLHVGSDGLIALAYFSIPIILLYFVQKRPNFPYSWILILFSAFILSCGTTHLMAIWTLWHPDYWLSGLIKIITAAISLYTALALIPIIPQVLALPSIKTLEQEIQRRHQIETELRTSQVRLRGILEMADDAIISFNEHQQITLFNQGAERIFGWKTTEVLGKSLDTLLPVRFRSLYQQYFYSKKMENRQKIWGLRQNNTDFQAEASISKLELPEETLFTVFLRDITERTQAEDTLRRYERIVSATSDAIILIDNQYTYQLVNQSYLNWHLKTLEEVIGHSVADLFGEDVFITKIKPYLDRSLAGETVQLQNWFDLPNGGRQFISATYSPYGDDEQNSEVAQNIVCVVVSLRNITEIKRIEENLSESKLKFRQLIDNVRDVLYIIDTKTFQVLYLNEAFEKIWGIPCEQVYQNPLAWIERVHPEDREKIKMAFEYKIKGANFDEEYRIVRPDGEIRWIWSRSFPVFDENGQVYRIAGIAEDITVRKKEQKQLELQDIIVKNMAEGICLVSMKTGELVYANPKFEQMFGYEAGELTGKHVSIVNYSDEKKSAEDVNQEIRSNVLNKGEYSYEVYNVKKDGTAFWCRATTSSFNHPDYGTVLVAVQEDIDDSKKIEDELRKSEEKLQYLITSSPVVIFSSKPDGDFGATYISDNVMNVLGYPAKAFLEDSRFWIDRVHSKDLKRILAQIPQLWEQELLTQEFRFLKADGTYCWVLEQIRLMRDESGKEKEILGYLVDISDRKQAEDLIAASLQEKEVLLKEIHHRVKNNLQIIYSLLNLQSRLVQDAGIKELLKDSQNRIRSMAIIHEKLYKSHNLASINLEDYVNDLVRNLLSSYYIVGRKVHFKSQIEPTIFLDIDTAVPCGLILNELISNACKYAFEPHCQGEITLQGFINAERQLVLILKDNGKGLPRDIELDNVKTLGLRLVKNLSHQLRGTVIIERQQGTQFYITLTRVSANK